MLSGYKHEAVATHWQWSGCQHEKNQGSDFGNSMYSICYFFTPLLREEETPACKQQLGDPVLFTPQCCDTMVTSTPKKGG